MLIFLFKLRDTLALATIATRTTARTVLARTVPPAPPPQPGTRARARPVTLAPTATRVSLICTWLWARGACGTTATITTATTTAEYA